jgi:hypothetical protein
MELLVAQKERKCSTDEKDIQKDRATSLLLVKFDSNKIQLIE